MKRIVNLERVLGQADQLVDVLGQRAVLLHLFGPGTNVTIFKTIREIFPPN
jgi:hypothetical protein